MEGLGSPNSTQGPSHSSIDSEVTTRSSFLPNSRHTVIAGGELNNSGGDHIRIGSINYYTLSVPSNQAPLLSSSTTSSSPPQALLSLSVDEGNMAPANPHVTLKNPPESNNKIYERHMLKMQHGFPLWIPQPNLSLPGLYQEKGVSIGDVGIITPFGAFDFLFNIFLPIGHPTNPRDLPKGFSPFHTTIQPFDICEYPSHSSQSYFASHSVRKLTGLTFECSDESGAILTMPEGAHDLDLWNPSRLIAYAKRHAVNWYKYTNGPRRRGIENGQLRIVVGCDKTTAWGMASYGPHAEQNNTLLKFDLINPSDDLSSHVYAWEDNGFCNVKAGPEPDFLNSNPINRRYRNQCTFVRSYTLTLNDDLWEEVRVIMVKQEEDDNLDASEETDRINSPGLIRSALNYLGTTLSGINSQGAHDGVTIASDHLTEPTVHPSTTINNYLLSLNPEAQIAITHDRIWCSPTVYESCDWAKPADMPMGMDLCERVAATHDIVINDGALYFETMSKTRLPVLWQAYAQFGRLEDLQIALSKKLPSAHEPHGISTIRFSTIVEHLHWQFALLVWMRKSPGIEKALDAIDDETGLKDALRALLFLLTEKAAGAEDRNSSLQTSVSQLASEAQQYLVHTRDNDASSLLHAIGNRLARLPGTAPGFPVNSHPSFSAMPSKFPGPALSRQPLLGSTKILSQEPELLNCMETNKDILFFTWIIKECHQDIPLKLDTLVKLGRCLSLAMQTHPLDQSGEFKRSTGRGGTENSYEAGGSFYLRPQVGVSAPKVVSLAESKTERDAQELLDHVELHFRNLCMPWHFEEPDKEHEERRMWSYARPFGWSGEQESNDFSVPKLLYHLSHLVN